MEWLLERIASFGDRPALIGRGGCHTYRDLADSVVRWQQHLRDLDITPGDVVAVRGDYSPSVCSLLVALLTSRAIVVPLGRGPASERQLDVAQARHVFSFSDGQAWQRRRRRPAHLAPHPLLERLRRADDPGLVVFTSGSTGESKGAVLSVGALLGKFRTLRQGYRTLVFLQLDHIGGVNTLLHILTQGGAAATADERTPEAVCAAIATHRIQLLPTTPTFINMLLISEAYRHHDLSSLELITYGTEPMPASTLAQVREVLPAVRLKQTYGLTEIGIVATAAFSRSTSDELARLQAKVESDGDFLWAAVDGRDREAVRDFVKQVVDRHERIDVLVNNAAVGLDGLFTLSRPSDIANAVDVNLLGPIWLTQACAKVMLTQQSGSIVVISSINASRGHAGVSVYSATKAALEGMTRSLARELGPKNIRVNAVAPGFFESDMVKGLSPRQKEAITRRTPLNRLPAVANIVDAVMFLTSDQAALITGQTIAVDGGMSC